LPYFEHISIAYSFDHGRIFTKYDKNPVIANPGIKDFRDPKVFWHSPTNRWICIIAVQNEAWIYCSRNLKEWEFRSTFDSGPGVSRFWECPDLFPLRIEGSDREKWVVIHNTGDAPNGGSGTCYHIGMFDGKVFTKDNPGDKPLWFEYGPDNYAGITWDNTPDSRRILIGWMSNWAYAQSVPTESWRGAMTIPRELWLKETYEGLRLFQGPVKELQTLRKKPVKLAAALLENKTVLPEGLGVSEMELSFDLKNSIASGFGVELANNKGEYVRIGFEQSPNRFVIDRAHSGKTDFHEKYKAASRPFAPRESDEPLLNMRLLIDVASVELFADNGRTVMSAIFFPGENFTRAALYAEGGRAAFAGGNAWPLGSIRLSRPEDKK
jgi:fructan beta-fructosidase